MRVATPVQVFCTCTCRNTCLQLDGQRGYQFSSIHVRDRGGPSFFFLFLALCKGRTSLQHSPSGTRRQNGIQTHRRRRRHAGVDTDRHAYHTHEEKISVASSFSKILTGLGRAPHFPTHSADHAQTEKERQRALSISLATYLHTCLSFYLPVPARVYDMSGESARRLHVPPAPFGSPTRLKYQRTPHREAAILPRFSCSLSP